MAGEDIFDSLNYVSRGGQKLAKALDIFRADPQGRVCIDCGASTGGFTDCLLQRGARYVYAIDVGYGQLAWTLRNDPRVCVMERTNIRHVTGEMLTAPDAASSGNTADYKPDFAVIDVSFISLSLVLPVMKTLGISEIICLIKPQFEAGKGKVGKRGVVSDISTHDEVLQAFINHANESGYCVCGITHSPVKGPKGNIEFPAHLKAKDSRGGAGAARLDIAAITTAAHKELG